MPKARSFVPTRLLDISGKPGAHIKVVETAKTSVQGPYCSLSHSWGPKPNFVRLLRNNINLFTTEGVPWSLFTKNFKEAVEIARTLDIGYIWIDSLCIIQMDAQDWEHEASRMHLVYRNSYCNIALADAIDQYGGAFRGREPESVLPVQYKSKKDSPMFHGKKWRIVPEDLWTRELLHSRLYTRGWVFQGMSNAPDDKSNAEFLPERMLSPRILHFAKNQIFWDCPSLSACEALPAGLPRPMDSTAAPDRHWRGRLQESEGSQDIAGSNDQPLSTFWQTAVRNYTSCELTKRKDKLIALWGIAKLIKDVMGVEYGEGLWEDHLEDQLTWRVAECKHEERPVTEDRHIPSWSWASMDGEIIIADRLSDKEHRTICDHNGHDLELDLKGVKRYARSSLLPGRPSGPGPMLKQRVQSDSVLEVKHSTTKAHNDQSAHYDGTHPQTSSNAAKVDEDAEPTLHHSSIAIQGHINSGILELDQSKNSWILRLNGKETFDMDAYPDTVPDRTRLEHTTKFVVLSTKKVVKPRKEWIPAGSSGDIELEGRGILLEPVSDKAKDHFRRVGAFEFRGASAQTFDRLLVTDGWERLSSKEFDPKLGRKFWLV